MSAMARSYCLSSLSVSILGSDALIIYECARNAEQYVWDKVIGAKTKSSKLISCCRLGGCSSGSVRTQTNSAGTPSLLDSPASPATQHRRLLFLPDAKRPSQARC